MELRHPHSPGQARTVCPGLKTGPVGHGAPVSAGRAKEDMKRLHPWGGFAAAAGGPGMVTRAAEPEENETPQPPRLNCSPPSEWRGKKRL